MGTIAMFTDDRAIEQPVQLVQPLNQPLSPYRVIMLLCLRGSAVNRGCQRWLFGKLGSQQFPL
ncbi:MAG TPA: hypothetical protein VIS06_00770, partial [Mycobacteriales bacterium]